MAISPKLLTSSFLIIISIFSGTAKNITNIFYLGKDICGPVCIRSSGGTFYVNSGDKFEGNLNYLEAFDCMGNKILDVSPDETQYSSQSGTTRIYRFETLYSTSDGSNSETDNAVDYAPNNSPSGNSIGETVAYSAANSLMSAFSNASGRRTYVPVDGYPFGALSVGMSRFYGEFARLSVLFGGMTGFHMFGGVGKDWIFNGVNKDKLAWHAGIGAYFSWGWDFYDESTQAIRLDVAVGESPVVCNKAILIEVTYEHFFGESQRFGVFGGVGYSMGDFKAVDPVFDWDFQAGIIVKLWTH